MPEQVEQQKRDSWKPRDGGERRTANDGRDYTENEFRKHYGVDRYWSFWQAASIPNAGQHADGFGPNTRAVHAGKRSRFARHLQLEAGSKTIAELIVYTGRFDPEFLRRANEGQRHSGASQPAASEPAVQRSLKRSAASAKLDYRKTVKLTEKLRDGRLDEFDLDFWQRRNLDMLLNGKLLERTNHAVQAYGHGTVRRPHGGEEALQIGGSTGGTSRELLDDFTGHDVQAFLDGR